MIQISNLHKWFGDFHVLKNVSMDVAKGEKIVVCGPSGSGKSTLIRCINRLEAHQQGSIVIDGVELTDDLKNVELVRREVGMVFQSFNLISFKTALENVALPLFYQKVPRRERQKRAMEMLGKMGMDDRADHLPSELSGGQKQRVAIARALITSPRVILADEPTGALDSATSSEVMEVLREVNASGITVIIVTHEADIAAQCDRTIRLHDGVIIEDGRSGEVVEPTARGARSQG